MINASQLDLRKPEVPFADFNPWFLDLVNKTKPKIVVAIARGAVRLLQLQMAKQMLPDVLITSECALPFLPDSMLNGQKVLVFDDSLIFGSTMWEVRNYLRVHRKAKVECAAYIIDRETFYGESRTPIEPNGKKRPVSLYKNRIRRCNFRHKLWQTPVRQHHSNLVANILRTSGHYNLDFPSFSLKLAPFSIRDVHEIIRCLSDLAAVSEIRDVCSSLSANYGIYRCSMLLKQNFMPDLGVEGVAVREYSKVRVTINIATSEVRVTPIPQLAMREGFKFEDVVCSDDRVTSMWRTLTPPRSGDENYSRALFRQLTSFVGVLLGTAITEELCTTLALSGICGLSKGESPVQEVGLLAHDVEAVLGRENMEALARIHAKCKTADLLNSILKNRCNSNTIVEPCDETLMESVVQKWISEPRLAPHTDEFPCEALAKVFLTVRAVTDNPERRKKYPYAKRLQVGLPYKGIYDLLVNNRSMRLSPTDLAFALDVCIDHGQAVPKILLVNHTWVRAFYAGEGADAEQLKQLALNFNQVYREFREDKKTKPLTGYDINKLGASLKNVLEWLPISTKSFTYGKVCMVGRDELPEWLTKGDKPLTATEKGLFEANPNYIFQPNLKFSSSVKPTWTPQQKRDFSDAFRYTANAFQQINSEIANDAKLLMSTCRTQIDTYDAYACEAHAWVSHSSHLHFGTLLDEIRIIPRDFTEQTPSVSETERDHPLVLGRTPPNYSGEITKHGMDALAWSCVYINEAFKKRHIFSKRFEVLSNALRKAFYSQGSGAKSYWDCFIEEPGIIDSSRAKELDEAFDTLAKLVSMEVRLTAYATVFLIRSDILSLEALTQALNQRQIDPNAWLLNQKKLPVLASEYNSHFAYMRSRGLTSIATLIPEQEVLFQDRAAIEVVLTTMRKCYNELGSAIRKDCPERELLEGERFRFAWRFEKARRPEPFQPSLISI